MFENDPAKFNYVLCVSFACIPLHLILTLPLLFSAVNQVADKTREVLNTADGNRDGRRSSRMTPSILFGFVSETFFPSLWKRRGEVVAKEEATHTSTNRRLTSPAVIERNEQMRTMLDRLVCFKWTMIFIWIPAEIAGRRRERERERWLTVTN